MTYDYTERKIVSVLRDDIETWQAMNALGHMAIALGARKDDHLMGKPTLTDASGVDRAGIARYGVIIKKATGSELSALARAARDDATVIVTEFTRDMLETRHDDELVAAIAQKKGSEIEYLGVLVYGPKEPIQSLTKSFALF